MQAQGMDRDRGLLHRLFSAHPRELGVGYLQHAKGAATIGASMVGAGIACWIHAVVPGLFTTHASRTVERLADHMARGRARPEGRGEPTYWLDYEI